MLETVAGVIVVLMVVVLADTCGLGRGSIVAGAAGGIVQVWT